jgi:hypothetical protein
MSIFLSVATSTMVSPVVPNERSLLPTALGGERPSEEAAGTPSAPGNILGECLAEAAAAARRPERSDDDIGNGARRRRQRPGTCVPVRSVVPLRMTELDSPNLREGPSVRTTYVRW